MLSVPSLAPGVKLTRVPGVSVSRNVAWSLLKTGVFHITPTPGLSPEDMLAEQLGRVSPATRGQMSLCLTDADEDSAALLSVRYRTPMVYSLHRSLKRFDRWCPGILGGLLNRVRLAARLTAPLFTPVDALRESSRPFDRHEDTQDEAAYFLRTGLYAHLSKEEIDSRVEKLSLRDAARLMARDGRTTPLDDHKLGWTLGQIQLTSQDLALEVQDLPADLRAAVHQSERCVEQLRLLACRMPP